MNITCMIVDDEPNAVSLLEVLVKQCTQWQIAAKCYDGLEAIAFLKTNKVDLVFLDINMPQLSGMELAALLPARTKIVFTTAYSEYAAESYTYQTVDYLLKPITLKRFLASVQKIEQGFGRQTAETPTPATPAGSASGEYFFVKSGKVVRKILLEDILYFEGEKEYVRLVTGHEQILIYRRLKDIEDQLLPPFIRVHNSYIINSKLLVKIEDNHIFIGDRRIAIGEKFKDGFMALINRRKF